jgi:hypothetical protein
MFVGSCGTDVMARALGVPDFLAVGADPSKAPGVPSGAEAWTCPCCMVDTPTRTYTDGTRVLSSCRADVLWALPRWYLRRARCRTICVGSAGTLLQHRL